ncbi:protein of unknown function [Burkholderia multivorans]
MSIRRCVGDMDSAMCAGEHTRRQPMRDYGYDCRRGAECGGLTQSGNRLPACRVSATRRDAT